MKYQLFGTKMGLRVSELALGTSNFGTGTGYGADPAEARRIWEGYVAAGGNFIDVSDSYQQGEAERQVGRFMGPDRGDFVLTSKYTRTENPAAALAQLGNHRKAMTQAVEASLRRLGTDYLDLYLVHLPDGVTPVAEIARGFEDLARAGKILYGGFSNFPAWRVATAVTLAELRGWVPLAGMQVEFSLLQREAERELLPMAEGLGLGVMGYSPLGGGILTGKYRRGETGRAARFGAPTHSPHIDTVLEALLAIAQEVGAAPGQVATAWALTRGIVPIIGARTRQQLDEQLGAATLTLSPEQRQRLAAASAVPLGYPHDLLAGQQNLLTGNRADRVNWPTRPVA